MSRTTIYRKVKDGDFPKPVNISDSRVAFVLSEVIEWQEALMGARKNG